MTLRSSEERFPVLIVDDSPVARKLVERALPVKRYESIFAATGSEALDILDARRPGLVITDWVMPDISGIELCERIRSDHADRFTYIILLTRVSAKESLINGFQAGADDYLTKPFDPDELLARTGAGRRIVELHREIEATNRFLEQLALTDALTGLPNRRAIDEWASRQLCSAVRHNFPFWVIASDLDNFKAINDVYGHDAGDTVLKEFSRILKANTRQCDICGRVGGDEFFSVITHGRDRTDFLYRGE